MRVTLEPDFPISDESCLAATGKTFDQWFAWIEEHHPKSGRRDVIRSIWELRDRPGDMWWETTIWVEYEASKGIFKKDGLAEGYNICVTKSIAAPVAVIYALMAGSAAEGDVYADPDGHSGVWLRLRLGKDIRLSWQTAGIDAPSLVDCAFAEKGGKTGITLNHQRIQSRAEADGLRKAWGELFASMKSQLEG